jgi:hypothetical protein
MCAATPVSRSASNNLTTIIRRIALVVNRPHLKSAVILAPVMITGLSIAEACEQAVVRVTRGRDYRACDGTDSD